jgi:hypothetical protein
MPAEGCLRLVADRFALIGYIAQGMRWHAWLEAVFASPAA